MKKLTLSRRRPPRGVLGLLGLPRLPAGLALFDGVCDMTRHLANHHRVSKRFLADDVHTSMFPLRTSQPENSLCRTSTGSVRFRFLLVSRSSCASGHLFSAHHTLLRAPPRMYIGSTRCASRLRRLAGQSEKPHCDTFSATFFLFRFVLVARGHDRVPTRFPPFHRNGLNNTYKWSLPSCCYLVYTKNDTRAHICLFTATVWCAIRVYRSRNALRPRTTAAGSILVPLAGPDLSPGPHLVSSCCVPSVPSYTPSRNILPAYVPHCTLTRTSTTTTDSTDATAATSTRGGDRARWRGPWRCHEPMRHKPTRRRRRPTDFSSSSSFPLSRCSPSLV